MNSRNTKSKREKLKNLPLEKLESVYGGCQAPPPSLVLAALNPPSKICSQLYYSLNMENTRKSSQENEKKKLSTNYGVEVGEESKKWRRLEHVFIFFLLSIHCCHSLFLYIPTCLFEPQR